MEKKIIEKNIEIAKMLGWESCQYTIFSVSLNIPEDIDGFILPDSKEFSEFKSSDYKLIN